MRHLLDLARSDSGTLRLVELNLRLFRPAMTSIDGLLGAIAHHFAQRLGVDHNVIAKRWKSKYSPTVKMTHLMEDQFLSANDDLVILAIDQTDEILEFDLRDDFFGMLRSWAESSDLPKWSSLRIAMAAPTVHLTKDIHKSPFQNLSKPIELDDLQSDQVEALAGIYQLGWTKAEVKELMSLVGGQPYLIRSAMHSAAVSTITLGGILAPGASTFSAHIERCRKKLRSEPKVAAALATMKNNGSVALPDAVAETLQRLGVVIPDGPSQYRLRYPLYERL